MNSDLLGNPIVQAGAKYVAKAVASGVRNTMNRLKIPSKKKNSSTKPVYDKSFLGAQVSASGIGRRRGRRRGGRGRGGGGRREAMPVSVSSMLPKVQYSQIGSPVHKEWGSGVRIQGVDIIGSFQIPSDTTSQYIFSSSSTRYSTNTPSSGFTTYYDPYWGIDVNYGVQAFGYIGQVMSMHPAFLPRLNREAVNWGRYVYRKFEVFSEPVSNTTEPLGYVAGLSHNVTWPLNDDQIEGIESEDVVEMDLSASGAFYDAFSLKAGDYSGDRTYPCLIMPTFVQDTGGGSPQPYEARYISDIVNDYHQYMFCTRMASNGTGSTGVTPGFRGFLFARYVIDFYVRETNATDLGPAFFYKAVTPSLSPSEKEEEEKRIRWKHGDIVKVPRHRKKKTCIGPELRPVKPTDSKSVIIDVHASVPAKEHAVIREKKYLIPDKFEPISFPLSDLGDGDSDEEITKDDMRVIRRFARSLKISRETSSI
jgi:hypothetical protein